MVYEYVALPNSYVLSNEDKSWMDKHRNDEPSKFVRGILKRRFDDYKQHFRNMGSLAVGCREIVKANPWAFGRFRGAMPKDAQAFLSLNDHTTHDTIRKFRDLSRGYSDDDVLATQKEIHKDKLRFFSLVRQMKRKNKRRLRKMEQMRRQDACDSLRRNEKQLYEIEKSLPCIFDDVENAARRKLAHLSFARRHPGVFGTWLSPDDYFSIGATVRSCDPDRILFPLRFLVHYPARLVESLRYRWESGLNREELLLSFDVGEHADRTIFDGIRTDLEKPNNRLQSNRLSEINELESIYSQGCFTSSVLLAITVTEGIIWDFAEYLNREGKKIFKKTGKVKPKYHPYQWDHNTGKYKSLIHGVPQADMRRGSELRSARALLKETRVGNYICEELYSYLIDEFYDDRNNFAHGFFRGRNMKAEAIASVLCLCMCVRQISQHL